MMHKELANGGWQKLSLMQQMGNIGSEISRAKKWQGKDEKIFNGAVDRALELFDLTLSDTRWQTGLKEIARAREFFCDALFGSNQFQTSLEDLDRYFFQFALAARR